MHAFREVAVYKTLFVYIFNLLIKINYISLTQGSPRFFYVRIIGSVVMKNRINGSYRRSVTVDGVQERRGLNADMIQCNNLNSSMQAGSQPFHDTGDHMSSIPIFLVHLWGHLTRSFFIESTGTKKSEP
jgi:hypothetical protein